MRIIVTGGLGFIGRNLVPMLKGCGHEILVVDNWTGRNRIEGVREKIAQDATVVYRDISDFASIYQDYPQFKGNHKIIHLAAQAGVPQSVEDPVGCYWANVMGTIKMIDAAVQHECRGVIHASSSSVYDSNKEGPKREDMRLRAFSPYAASKIAVEQMVAAMGKIHKFCAINLRLFNVFGPGQSCPDAAIPSFFRSAITEEPIRIFGSGMQGRDFTFVDDVCRAFVNALDCSNIGEFNISEGKSVRISTAAIKVWTTVHKGGIARIEHHPRREGDIFDSCGWSSWSQGVLKWKPRMSFNEGIAWTYEWWKKYPDGRLKWE